MYVCVCYAISDRQIRDVVNRGATSLDEVKMYLPVAGCCGRCEDIAREVIATQSNAAARPSAA